MKLSTKHGYARAILALSGLAILLLIVPMGVSADVLIDNLGTDATKYQTVYGPNANGVNGETGGGISFSPTADYYLNSISIIGNYVSGSNAAFDLALFSDNAGLPSSLIASVTIVPDAMGTFKTYSADFGSTVTLTAGTTYWAAIYTTGASNDILLRLQKGPYDVNNSPVLPSARRAMYGNMGEKLPDGSPKPPYWMHMWNAGILVTGSVVPEPSGLLALIGGIAPLAGLAGLRRRINK